MKLILQFQIKPVNGIKYKNSPCDAEPEQALQEKSYLKTNI